MTLAKVPLVLPTEQFGLRQLLNEAARTASVKLRPRDEVDSLALLVALLEREPVCTVLPPSALGSELVLGELLAHPIIEPTISRPLHITYGADRSLTLPERDLVALLREALNGNEKSRLNSQ
jgi:LysR family transcriptional regulator, nitrogen assimilation regulatory protein